MAAFADALAHLRREGDGDAWVNELADRAQAAWAGCRHGDRARWVQALAALPETEPAAAPDRPAPRLGTPVADPQALRGTLMELHPWRKGPLELGGVPVDCEWRSDWKWDRVRAHVDLTDSRVLDIGCGNGYFGWRMLGAGARQVVGIDPTWVYVMQWLACRHFAGVLPNYVLPLKVEDLPSGQAGFDAVFSMGVLYHRRDPAEHLRRLRALLRPGGRLVLETLVLPGDQPDGLLVPEGRYARMRNVWAVPGVGRLARWVAEAGFADVDVADVTATTPAEQRSTEWMRFQSLSDALEKPPQTGRPGVGPVRTVEGHPGPIRALVTAWR
ncbi:tRNA 5-methoxyuridine(34)/uridine 5-oxyacetic acid(34) synthase CmoB [Elongatibacter sediminis]|uniref:tRNA U34 carboxymethyltransferase n=1 Tax=Elongatibacter sediminis TaxID=3119006 RepID=A0AAW9RH13_9GAMM